MPALIDYAARFELTREAAFDVVRTRGVAALCLDSVAAELGQSPATLRRLLASPDVLPQLALQWVEGCRRRRIYGPAGPPRLGPDPDVRAMAAIMRLLPETPEQAEEERVWEQVVRAGELVAGELAAGELAAGEPVAGELAAGELAAGTGETHDGEPTQWAHAARAQQQQHREKTVSSALAVLLGEPETPESVEARESDRLHVLALVTGMVALIRSSGVAPEVGRGAVRRLLEELRTRIQTPCPS